jgi:RimJ/RimL family protein N-acetyltransferase
VRAVAEMTATWPHPLPEGEAGRRIKAARALDAEGKALILAVTSKGAPDRLIGTIGSGAPAEGVATIGYMLDPAVHGRGLATEAVEAFVRVLFTHGRVDGVAATCRVENRASRRVLEKNGFELVRTGLSETKVRGEVVVDFLELSRRDWREWLALRRRLDGADAPARTGRDISAPLQAKGLL